MIENTIIPKMRRVHKIHFVGIGGAGMSGIAEVLYNQGYDITGSDIADSRTIDALRALGITVIIGHNIANIKDADVIVRSSAIADDNVEIVAAISNLIPVIPRAVMLAELMRFRHGIAIAGTHGKTTTTSLVTSLLAEGGLDPSFVIGGKLNSCGSNAQLGNSPYFVVEADESDASFLYLKPMMAVVTNIDSDHLSTYHNDFAKLRGTFIEFLHHLPFYGLAVLCNEDVEIHQIIANVNRPIVTYGFSADSTYKAVLWQQRQLVSTFRVERPKPHLPLDIEFHLPGKHNVLNALAAIAIATELGVNDTAIVNGLRQFQGVGRRFQILGEKEFRNGKAIFIDDYGHHPKEIIATIETCRRVWPEKRLIHIFQPHRYTRTQELFTQFVAALSLADILLLLDIYPAGEEPIPSLNSSILLEQIKLNKISAYMVSTTKILATLEHMVLPGDVILAQGAGNIGQLALNIMSSSLDINTYEQ